MLLFITFLTASLSSSGPRNSFDDDDDDDDDDDVPTESRKTI